MFGIDPDTFEVTSYGTIASSWQWSDAAASPAVEEGLFGRMVGICMNGTYLEMLNPVEGTLSYWDLSTKGFADDPLATIAFIGSGTYDYNYLWYSYPDCPANFYYAMTESGELYKFNMFTYDGGEGYSMVMEDLGNTGLELTNVSAVTGGQYASMIYDQATGYLLVSSYQDGETAKLYAIDPAELIPAEIGNFGEKVWPVVSLYQYNRATDLTLKVNPTDVTIYVGESKEISTKVIGPNTEHAVPRTPMLRPLRTVSSPALARAPQRSLLPPLTPTRPASMSPRTSTSPSRAMSMLTRRSMHRSPTKTALPGARSISAPRRSPRRAATPQRSSMAQATPPAHCGAPISMTQLVTSTR